MPGPEPNPNRRRRNVPVKVAEAVHLDPAGRRGPIPKPRLPEGSRLSAQAEQMWRDWWRSPQATQWHMPTAVHGLTRLLCMYEHLWTYGLAPKDQTELRQLESRYGLNPKGMRELKWVVGDELPAEPQSTQPTEVPDELADRRKRVAAKAAGG
jgi:hypothetical protein